MMRHGSNYKVASVGIAAVCIVAFLSTPVNAALIPVRDYPFCVKLDSFWDQLMGDQRISEYFISGTARTVVNARDRINSHRQTQLLAFQNIVNNLSDVAIKPDDLLGVSMDRMKRGKDERALAAIGQYEKDVYAMLQSRDSRYKQLVDQYKVKLAKQLDTIRDHFFFQRMRTTSVDLARAHVEAYAYCKIGDKGWWNATGFGAPVEPAQRIVDSDSDERIRSVLAGVESDFRVRLGAIKDKMLAPYHPSEDKHIQQTGFYRPIVGVPESATIDEADKKEGSIAFDDAVKKVVADNVAQYAETVKDVDAMYIKSLGELRSILELETKDEVTLKAVNGDTMRYTIDTTTNTISVKKQ